MERKKRVVAIKNVTINEPLFTGHFPNFPIMPGVLIVEAIAQAGAALLLTECAADRASKLMVFTSIDDARFRRPVVPGDQLRIEVTVLNWRTSAVKMRGIATVDGKLACEATVMCAHDQPQARRTSRASRSLRRVSIHPTAIVAAGAQIPASCSIGPYCTVGPNVVLGEECELISHVVLDGHLTLGRGNRIYPFASVGVAPQDLKYAGEPTRCELGDNNTIRESVTISRGTVGGGGITRLGSGCLIMAYVHIGHDCQIGDGCILANAATLAGHVVIEEYAVVGALCPVHQYCRIGRYSYIGGGTTITQDVLPYSLTCIERNNHAYGLNKVGLERRGFTPAQLKALRQAYRLLQASKLNTTDALAAIRKKLLAEGDSVDTEHVAYLAEFIAASHRGVIK